MQIALLLKGQHPQRVKLANTCYSLVTPDYAFSIAGVYQPRDGRLVDVEGAGGISALEASDEDRAHEAGYAFDWFATITRQTYG